MNDERFDQFLDDATHKVNELWEGAGGQLMGTNELYSLNDVLTQFFADKRA